MSRVKNSIIAKILIYQLITYLICNYPVNALAQQRKVKRVQEYFDGLKVMTPEELLQRIPKEFDIDKVPKVGECYKNYLKDLDMGKVVEY